MKNLLLAGVFAAAFGVVQARSETLTLDVLINHKTVASATSSTGTLDFTGPVPDFSTFSVTVDGPPSLNNADITSTTLDTTVRHHTSAFTLTLDIMQTGVSSLGNTHSTFTVNNLVGAGTVGDTTETTFFGGTNSTLGTRLASDTFPGGSFQGSAGPIAMSVGPFTADAQQYIIPFHAHTGPQSIADSIELTTVPESSTWAMILLGFAGLGYAGLRRARRESRPRLMA